GRAAPRDRVVARRRTRERTRSLPRAERERRERARSTARARRRRGERDGAARPPPAPPCLARHASRRPPRVPRGPEEHPDPGPEERESAPRPRGHARSRGGGNLRQRGLTGSLSAMSQFPGPPLDWAKST